MRRLLHQAANAAKHKGNIFEIVYRRLGHNKTIGSPSKFDSVAKLPECPDHSGSAGWSGVFRNRRAPFLIANAFIQNHPDQLTDALRTHKFSQGMVAMPSSSKERQARPRL